MMYKVLQTKTMISSGDSPRFYYDKKLVRDIAFFVKTNSLLIENSENSVKE